jgi:parallel beta-helix repeat protein
LNGYPELSTNLGYSLLKKGAIATVSASRPSLYRPSIYTTGVWDPDGYPDNTEIGYEYVKRLVENKSAGKALYDAISSFNISNCANWLNFMVFNLYGDPSIGLYTGENQQPVGKTIYVDDDKQDYPDADYEKIQHAIHHASPGDTIIVYPGTYEEQVDVNRKLTLKGIDHPVVDGLGSGHTVTMSAGGCVLAGFEVTNSAEDYAGIYVQSGDNIIKNNIANSHKDYGIYLDHSINNTIIDNTANLNNNEVLCSGIYLDYSNKNRITNNTASNNQGYGIHLYYSTNNILTNNIANSNDANGIYLEYSSDNTITKNKATNNREGIQFSDSNDNNIYLNNFMNNEGRNVQSDSDSSNIWSSTEKITYVYKGTSHKNYMGNYWDDYTGFDTDNDGIGDTAYSIKSDNDEYPLMEPIEKYSTAQPDLIVEDIWIEPAEFNPGEEVKLYARIKNIGDADAIGKFWWNRYIDDTFINYGYRDGLAAGDNKTTYKKYIWPADCKSHTIKVVVDAKGNITESNESNNGLPKTFSVAPVLTPTPTPTPSPTPVPETEGKIAFNRGDNICIMNADGSNQKQLTHSTETFRYPDWSWDNKYIAFQEGNREGIWVINEGGSNLKKITGKGISAGTPAWSPDGKIIFMKLEVVPAIRPIGGIIPELHCGICKINPDGSNMETLLNLGSVAEVGILACSKNNKIAYVEVASSKVNSGIWIMDSNGKNRKQIVKSSSVDYPAWSPDGKKIAFERNGDIWVVNVDGTDAKLLAKNGRDPAWSR